MKKIWVLTFIVSAVTSTIVYAGGYSFHDGVYRGEKCEFDFGKPKKNYITIIPKDIPEPRLPVKLLLCFDQVVFTSAWLYLISPDRLANLHSLYCKARIAE